MKRQNVLITLFGSSLVMFIMAYAMHVLSINNWHREHQAVTASIIALGKTPPSDCTSRDWVNAVYRLEATFSNVVYERADLSGSELHKLRVDVAELIEVSDVGPALLEAIFERISRCNDAARTKALRHMEDFSDFVKRCREE